MIEYVYKLRNNPNVVQFSLNGTPIDFSSVTRMVLKFEKSTTIEADSDVDASLITWDASGNVTFKLWSLAFDDCFSSPSTLVVYDAGHPDGQILVHDHSQDLIFTFYDG